MYVVDSSWGVAADRDASDLAILKALGDPADKRFTPSIFTTIDTEDLPSTLPAFLYHWLLRYYVSWARKVVRRETDVIMLTHLILYFTTTVPSAIFLFYRFSYIHATLHFAMQLSYMGPYTLMMHQHIHMGGILAKTAGLRVFDTLFPYITDPLMGHTWNTYFYHHVKHHHVEGNGPGDLSSTMTYQRDDIFHFLHYLGRFMFLVWLELPLYFLRRRRRTLAIKTALWEWSNCIVLFALFCWNSKPTFFVLLLPLFLMRVGMMVGNWGQHVFVDADDPRSDFRSSITLIDVPVRTPTNREGGMIGHSPADMTYRATASPTMMGTTLRITSILSVTGVTTRPPFSSKKRRTPLRTHSFSTTSITLC